MKELKDLIKIYKELKEAEDKINNFYGFQKHSSRDAIVIGRQHSEKIIGKEL